MTKLKQILELIKHAWDNLLVRSITFLLFVGFPAYLQFQSSGWTQFFWGLVILLLVLMVLFVGIPLIRSIWWHKREPTPNQTMHEILTALVNEFELVEKALTLEKAIENGPNIRVVSIKLIERKTVVFLNVGQEQKVKEGTRLVVYRANEFTQDGERIEQPIGVVEITYVQAGNNLSQAIVTKYEDEVFWDRIMEQLQRERSVDPPTNFVKPLIRPELGNLSLESVITVKRYLETVRLLLTNNSEHIESKETTR